VIGVWEVTITTEAARTEAVNATASSSQVADAVKESVEASIKEVEARAVLSERVA
jgi:hypothetical protein